jgi:HEAT repeat protein
LTRSSEFNFTDCLRRIRSRDPLTYEAAYHELLPYVGNYVPELLAALDDASDAYTRGKLIELLGRAEDPAAIPVLARELEHSDQAVRQWAVTSLVALCRPEADALVHDYRLSHPDEF